MGRFRKESVNVETQRIGLTWAAAGSSGWGIFGLNLALELLKHPGPQPLFFTQPVMDGLSEEQIALLRPLAAEQSSLMEIIQSQGAGMKATLKEVVIIHALINRFGAGEISNQVAGRKNIGFIFFEEAFFDDDALLRASQYDRILVGSTWNLEVLREFGIRNAALAIQGIDHTRFRPGPATGIFGDKFVVFSGGKAEIRKGQDIVIAAFRQFHRKHPDSLLVTAWQSPWPETAAELAMSYHVETGPAMTVDRELAITEWAVANGIPSAAVIDLRWIKNETLPEVLRSTHAGLFPNRAEGGTNLIAMEAMACGVPCILSKNTGHLDLISGNNCYPLNTQSKVRTNSPGMDQWGESSVDEIVDTLEQVYQDRREAVRRGQQAAEFMQDFTWSKQVAHLMDTIADLL